MTNSAFDYHKLSVAERVRLVEDIWDSIAQETGASDVPPEVLDEAERRLAEHRQDPESAIAWDQIKDDFRKRTK